MAPPRSEVRLVVELPSAAMVARFVELAEHAARTCGGRVTESTPTPKLAREELGPAVDRA